MPWVPELFTAPTLRRIEDEWQRELVAVPYFDGLVTGEIDALVESFAGEPELYDPLRGRVKGVRAFKAFVAYTSDWLSRRNVTVEKVERVVLDQPGFEELILHYDGEAGRVDLPFAVVAQRRRDGRIEELRLYFSGQAMTGRQMHRPPLLQPDPKLREPGIVAEYQRALAAGDVEAIVAAFEPDGYACEPADGVALHTGSDALRGFYGRVCATGGVELERCAVIDDGHSCALEYNVVQWGAREQSPQAGLAVYVRGENGKLAAARRYGDADRPDALT